MPKLSDRLKEIIGGLKDAEIFADIGCDHGYIAKAMLDGGKCKRVIVTDISAKSLKKAEDLLAKEYSGRYTAIVADGFNDVPYADEALIAGMGGEEIVKIISSAENLPKILALQPMKNSDKVRRALVKSGYKLIKDYTFKSDGKFYDYIVAEKTPEADLYDEAEYEYGRENLRYLYPDFKESVIKKRAALENAAANMKGDEKSDIEKKIAELNKIINDDNRVLR